MKRLSFLALAAAILFPTVACAQSSPNLYTGQIPSASDWNSYFSAKQDVSPVLTQIAGKTLQGTGPKVQLSIGSPVGNNCAKYDASGNTVDAGAPCGGAPGGTTNQVQYNNGGVMGGVGPGTVNQVLHGNASGAPSYGAVQNGDLANSSINIGGQATSLGGSTTNQGNGSKIQLSTGTTTPNDCVKYDASGNTVDAGTTCGGGGGGALTVTDGTTSVASTTTLTMGSGFLVSGGAGSATVNFTAPHTAFSANHTVAAGDMNGNLFLTGSATLTIPAISGTVFASGMTLCYTNEGVGVWTVSTTPTINGAPGTLVPAGMQICLVSNGTSLDAMVGAMGSIVPTALTISGSTFTPTGAFLNYTIGLTSGCPCTLANPAVVPNPGTEGTIKITQDGTGSRAITTWGSDYIIEGGVAGIALSTGANASDLFAYHVDDATHIHLTFASKGATH